MRTFLILITILILSTQLLAQDLEIFGYFEPQLMSVYMDDKYSQLFSNKLRVDLQTEFDGVKFAANFNYLNFNGHRYWELRDYIPYDVRNSVNPDLRVRYKLAYTDTLLLDNAYLKISKSIFDITLGKQQLSTGSGYAWNPTDLFNIKDAIDPTYEQPGHTAVRIDAALPSRFNAIVMYFPEDNWDNSGKLVRLKGNISHFDYSAIFVERYWVLTEYSGTTSHEGIRRLYGGDIVGELLSLGVWTEFGFNTFNYLDDFWEVILGVDYTFDNGLYMMGEYYYNELGKSDHNEYNFDDWMRFLCGEQKTISQDNLYLYLDYPLTDYFHLNNSLVTSLSDMSVSVVPSISYSMYQNVDLNVFLNFNIGQEGKAYFTEQGYSSIIRLRVYF